MQILFERYLYENHLASIGILPNVNSLKLNRNAKQVTSVCSRTTRLKNNQVKSRKRACTTEGCCQLSAPPFVPPLGCVSQDSGSVRISEKTGSGKPRRKVLGSIRRVRLTQSALRQASIRENKRPSLGQMQVKLPHHRSPYVVKFEDRSQEETERQERCARGDAWRLAKNFYKLKEKDKATFFSPTDEWSLPAASKIKLEEREFVVDSGASMHMFSRRDLSSAELKTVRSLKVRRRW